jgi:hypothetical protein
MDNTINGGFSVADVEAKKLSDLPVDNSSRDVIARGEGSPRSTLEISIYERAVQEWSIEDAEAVLWIVKRESGFNQYAQNKNCIGLGQRNYPNFTSEEREAYLNDLPRQIDDLFSYIRGRYGDGIRAKIWWQSHSWY